MSTGLPKPSDVGSIAIRNVIRPGRHGRVEPAVRIDAVTVVCPAGAPASVNGPLLTEVNQIPLLMNPDFSNTVAVDTVLPALALQWTKMSTLRRNLEVPATGRCR